MGLGNWGGRKILPEDVPAIVAAAQQPTSQAHPQPSGSLADLVGPQGGAGYLLGQGMRSGGLGRGFQNFKRYAVNRGGKILEAHDYGGDVPTKFFERKNPAVLQAAVQQSLGQGRPGAPPMPDLDPRDEELLKLLLGNPTLRR